MIHTSKQLKDKVRNISHGDNEIAQMMIRCFIMERFLERISLSEYKNNFILKGEMLVASLIGIDTRATVDIDTTVSSLPLNEEDTLRIVKEIIDIPIRKVSTIAEAFDQWRIECNDRFNELKANEEEMNRIFIDIYGVG